MSERKVLNKYFPPDFDPSKIPRGKKAKNKQQVVRLMAPFSMKCTTCAEYIYKGKKFNARKETVEGETYFGVKIFRFYIKCTRCSSEITFKTDPKNTDYSVEHGAQRNFEPWRESDSITQETEEERLNRLEAEELEEEENGGLGISGSGGDAMSALESRTIDSKREMDILDKLQEIRGRNARLERANPEEVLERISTKRDPALMDEEERQAALLRTQEEEEDEELVRKYFARGVVEPPSIELEGEDADGATGAVPGLGTIVENGDEEAGPSGTSNHEASPSNGSGGSSGAPTPAVSSSAKAGQPSTSVVKRKLVDVEPDAVSLLSEEARKIVGSASFKAPPLPPKKKKANGSSLLGIKLKSK